MIRVVLADDQQLGRTGFRLLLDMQPDIKVVGEAADGQRALTVAAEQHPDVVLMDIRMPVLGLRPPAGSSPLALADEC